ncbi:HAD family hydrolase [Micromonospora krabiensis]|uniref:Haloacid dehalogenase superfamily, subfamily IA, variant 1 with third motif having Dx(3-4)D or Dx(3-4)E n=1 Tax=Micromonospora krabiensis TaxID=307121 RepID=A0A1C3NCJ4_9ACTN|nr:HAD family hydrolase [Micromonospora krabiensis]SBV30258.1 haloacid dehalogenase superfamily, subfamily IA, variant 1 with third motif having Dx(3-4)D or Dx(3-4)E [Micromonospora krabiensis]
MIDTIFFDIGGTILDESREFETWADWLGVPRHTFSAVFGAVVARGLDYQETFRVFRPDFDLEAERERRGAADKPESFGEADLYPDARSCLTALKAQGLFVGLAGNQPAHAEALLHALDLPVDVIGTSHGWGVAKPSPAFFERVVREGGGDASSILYVGDRPDNDARPAMRAGMRACLVRRGPWGHILDLPAVAERCLFRVDSLDELPHLVAEHNATST